MVSRCRGRSSNLAVENRYAPVRFHGHIDDCAVGIKMTKMLVFDSQEVNLGLIELLNRPSPKKSFCSKPARGRDEDSSYQLLWERS